MGISHSVSTKERQDIVDNYRSQLLAQAKDDGLAEEERTKAEKELESFGKMKVKEQVKWAAFKTGKNVEYRGMNSGDQIPNRIFAAAQTGGGFR